MAEETPAENGNGAAAPAQPQQVRMQVLAQYVRDLSFENVVVQKGLSAGDSPDWSPNGRWIIYRNDEAPGPEQVFLSHPDGSGFRVLVDGGGDLSFTSSSFSPDGTQMTIGIYPGVGKKGNADVWIGHFGSHMRLDSLEPLTRTHRWESSPRWGTAPLLG